ncbi:hypothetical protein D3C71_2003550 [compost metagenome]
MAPFEVAVGTALATLGVNTIVWLLSGVGIPLPAVAAMATVMDHGAAVATVTLLTYFDLDSAT